MDRESLFRALVFVFFIAILGVRAYFNRALRRQGVNSWEVEQQAVDREGRWSILARTFLGG